MAMVWTVVKKWASIFLLTAWFPFCASCDVRFGGMTAHEAFPDEVATLVDAATKAEIGTMDRLIASGVDVNATGVQGVSPLIWTLAARNKKGVERLLKAGADPNYKMDKEVSAMSLAAGGNQTEILEILLRYGGDPNLRERGDPLLYIAAGQQQGEHVRLLLKHGADINADNGYGRTAAHIAAAMGRFDLVVYLLEQGLSAHLNSLARTVEIRKVPPASEQHLWKEKVIEMLKSRGVKFPAFIPKKPIERDKG